MSRAVSVNPRFWTDLPFWVGDFRQNRALSGMFKHLQGHDFAHLVAPYCAIPPDYLSDTPLARTLWGFWVSQHGQLGAIPPPSCLSVAPLENIREVEVRYPPSKGVSQRYLRDTL